MHVRQLDYLAVGIRLLKCQCSFVDIWSISINSSHVTGPHLKATLSLWKHQTNLWSCQTPKIMKTQINFVLLFPIYALFKFTYDKFWWFLILDISFASKSFWIWWLRNWIFILDYLMGRLDICQKNYTTGFLDQKFYTLKVRTLQLFLLKKKQRKCINRGH